MYNEFIGVDLHSTQVTVHRIIVGENGAIERKKGQYPMERMETHFNASLYPGCAVCVEAGSGSHMLARMIVAAGARAFVVNPLSLPQIFMTAKKTDRIDAKKLADCLKQHLENNDPNDGFPEVRPRLLTYILPSRNLPVSLWANSGMVALKRSISSARVQRPRERMARISDSNRSRAAAS
jgi:hypothetical protein